MFVESRLGKIIVFSIKMLQKKAFCIRRDLLGPWRQRVSVQVDVGIDRGKFDIKYLLRPILVA